MLRLSCLHLNMSHVWKAFTRQLGAVSSNRLDAAHPLSNKTENSDRRDEEHQIIELGLHLENRLIVLLVQTYCIPGIFVFLHFRPCFDEQTPQIR